MRMPRKFYSNSSSKSKSIYYRRLLSQLNSRRSPRFVNLARNGAARFSGSPNWSELKMWDERTLRRSMKKLKLMHADDMRKPPWLDSPSATDMYLNTSGSGLGIFGKSSPIETKSCLGKLESKNSGEKSLRQSSRLSAAITDREKVVRTISDAAKLQGYSGQELQLDADSENHRTLLLGRCLEENSVRSSPRLSSTQSGFEFSSPNVSSQKMLESQGKSCLRVMSRSNSDLHSDAKTCLVSSQKEASFIDCDVKFISENQLRKSPRLNSSTRGHGREASRRGLDVKSLDRMEFRRSPRFLSSSGNQNFKVFQKKETPKEKSSRVTIKSSKSTVEQHLKVTTTSGSSDPSIPDTKRLRCSAETIGSPFGIENDKMTCDSSALPESEERPRRKNFKTSAPSSHKSNNRKSISSFIGDPIPYDEAQKRWGWRYELKQKNSEDQRHKINDDEEDKVIVNVECHYAQAKVGNCIFNLEDCAYIKGEEGRKHIGKIVEFFQTTDKEKYFRVQWFYKIEDTVVQDEGGFHDKRRLFYSTIMDDNLIDCIIAKASVTHVTPRAGLKLTSISSSDFYCDMEYCVEYSTFRSTPTYTKKNIPSSCKTELKLLDLYSGCGGMSTGLCLGAKVSSVNLVTRWAVDSKKSACESLHLNHPETHVRNASAEEFLQLLKEWEKLCKQYTANNDGDRTCQLLLKGSGKRKKQMNSDEIPAGEYEVSRVVDICYGDPNKTGKTGLYFKVHWKGYSLREDMWEKSKDLSNCQERIQDFVRNGMKSNILPLPGDVDIICGGPPCQGISGYNRFRNTTSPLDDERNRQIVVFMDIVKFLKPKYVLMENVTDILKLDNASLGRYALSRLVHMNYQARLGTIAAGCYGLPQFRLRVFLWGAHPDEVLPQFPLPTHETVVKYGPPLEFERNTVAYDEGQPRKLEKAIVIRDAISDLPGVTNYETREEMSYKNPPETEFQRYIRSTKYEMTGSKLKGKAEKKPLLYDHRPCSVHEDDYLRVCQIPKRKGANFRDLPGVIVGADNVVRRDPKKTPLLPSGKPLVPDYAIALGHGKSKRPFARLWWDETVATVLTTPSCNTQAILHPEQDRVLTIREFARLQGFPDYYRFCGTVKERYCQIGNAVAVPVSRALGYALGMAYRKLCGDEPLMTLPPNFSHSNYLQLSKQSSWLH